MPSKLLPIVILLAILGPAVGSKPTPKHLTLKASLDAGTVVYLSDGSVWEVRPENRPKVATWAIKEKVAVYRNGDRIWPYVLVLRPGDSSGGVAGARRLIKVK